MGSALLVKLDAAIEGSVFGPVLAFKRTAQNRIAIKFDFVSTKGKVSLFEAEFSDMKLISLFLSLLLLWVPDISVADEYTYETQAALKSLGYNIGKVDGLYGPNTNGELAKFCESQDIDFNGKITPEIWVELATAAKQYFPIPYLSNDLMEFSPKSSNLLVSNSEYKYNNKMCHFLAKFVQDDTSDGWGHPVSFKNYQKAFSQMVVPNIENLDEFDMTFFWAEPTDFEAISGTFLNSLLASSQSCYSEPKNLESCQTVVSVANWFADQSAFVWNKKIDSLGSNSNTQSSSADTYYFAVKHVIMPLLFAYSSAIEILGVPDQHKKIGKWAYAALVQNTYDPFVDKKTRSRDMLFYEPDNKKRSACDKFALSLNHSLYDAIAMTAFGAIWNDANFFTQSFDRLKYSLNSGAINDEGVSLCAASRGAVAMLYSGADLQNILTVIEIGRRNGLNFESQEVALKVETMGRFLIDAAFNPELIYPYAKEMRMAWCSESYKDQCMFNLAFRNTSFAWVRHFMTLYPESSLTADVYALLLDPKSYRTAGENPERIASSILKSNFLIDEVKWELFEEPDDWLEQKFRGLNAPQFFNLGDNSMVSNICAFGGRQPK